MVVLYLRRGAVSIRFGSFFALPRKPRPTQGRFPPQACGSVPRYHAHGSTQDPRPSCSTSRYGEERQRTRRRSSDLSCPYYNITLGDCKGLDGKTLNPKCLSTLDLGVSRRPSQGVMSRTICLITRRIMRRSRGLLLRGCTPHLLQQGHLMPPYPFSVRLSSFSVFFIISAKDFQDLVPGGFD